MGIFYFYRERDSNFRYSIGIGQLLRLIFDIVRTSLVISCRSARGTPTSIGVDRCSNWKNKKYVSQFNLGKVGVIVLRKKKFSKTVTHNLHGWIFVFFLLTTIKSTQKYK